jgi:hypothetical protein
VVTTSMVINSSDRSSTRSTMGQMNVPPPRTRRKLRRARWPLAVSVTMDDRPEMMSTSLGPTFL